MIAVQSKQYDITNARFLIERAGLDEAQAMVKIVYAVRCSFTRRADHGEAKSEGSALVLLPQDYRKAGRELVTWGVLRARPNGEYEAAVSDDWLDRVILLLRGRLCIAHSPPGFPSSWSLATRSWFPRTSGRHAPDFLTTHAVRSLASADELRRLFPAILSLLDTLLAAPEGEAVPMPRNRVAEYLADRDQLHATGGGCYRLKSREHGRQLREVYEGLIRDYLPYCTPF